MAYIGKYIDRNPTMKAAGLPLSSVDTTGDTMKIYSTEEAARDIILAKCKYAEKLMRCEHLPHHPFLPVHSIHDIFSTELKKSRFVSFREKFAEGLYFKKPRLGKAKKLHSKPDEITNESTTFGRELNRSEPLYETVLPKKSAGEVNREYANWHDKYIISHNHYFPSERINRHYDPRYFNPDFVFGYYSRADQTGNNVKRCLNHCTSLLVISKAHKNFLEKSLGVLGTRVNDPHINIPAGVTFGKLTEKDECDVKALLEHLDPCPKQSSLVDAIAHIIKLRRLLMEKSDYQMFDLKKAFEKNDLNNTGELSLTKIFEIARSKLIRVNEDKIRTIVKHFNFLKDEGLPTERIEYEEFLRLIQVQYPLPKTGNLSTMPKTVYNKDTIYRDLCKDREKAPTELPPLSEKHAKILKDKATMKDIVSPLPYGLGLSDFAQPRTKDELRRIFKRILTDNFDQVWKCAKEKLNPVNDLLSVNEFRTVLSKAT